MPHTRATSTLAEETQERSHLQIENARHKPHVRDIMSQEMITVTSEVA